MAYKKSSKQYQAKADRITLSDFVKDGEDLFGEDRLKMLRAEVQKIEVELLKSPIPSRRKQLGKMKFILQAELTRMKGIKRPGLEKFFIESARRILPKEIMHQIWEEAQHAYDIYNKPKNDSISAQNYAQAEKLGVEI